LIKKRYTCIFVGHSEDTKAYKLYDPVTTKFIMNKDVQFVDNETWYGTMEKIVKIVKEFTRVDISDEENMGHVVVPPV